MYVHMYVHICPYVCTFKQVDVVVLNQMSLNEPQQAGEKHCIKKCSSAPAEILVDDWLHQTQ